MHRDLSSRIIDYLERDDMTPAEIARAAAPRHPDPMILVDLMTPAPGCKQPSPPNPTTHPYLCSRTRGHTGQHVAGIGAGQYLAEWDDDRTTDLDDLETGA